MSSGERLFLIFPMKPRLGLVVLVPADPGSSRGRPNEAARTVTAVDLEALAYGMHVARAARRS
jgi:hypothetical protein